MNSKDIHAQLTRSLLSLSLPGQSTSESADDIRRAEMVSSLCSYLLTHWAALPEYSQRAIDFNALAGSTVDESTLKQLARVFMEYAEIALKQALALQRQEQTGH